MLSTSDALNHSIYEFGPFQVQSSERQLLRNGIKVPVTAKTFDTLLFLLQRRGRLVEKSEIMEAIWPDSFVEEGNLSVTIHMIRRALGDDGEHKYIETISKRGYRFAESAREIVKSSPEWSGVPRTHGLPLTRLPQDSKVQPAQWPSNDSKAYQFYLKGRYFWNKRTENGLRRSIECFQQATIEDPQYAVAYAGLADSYALLGSYGVEPAQQAYPSAKSAALKALQLDASLSETYTSLGMISFFYEWNWPQAEREFRCAIDLNPKYPLARTWYAVYLAAVGRNSEAIDEVQRAQELDPVSLIINTEVGRIFYLTHKHDQAVVAYRGVIDLDPHFARAHTRLGMAYAAERNFGEAINEFQQAKQISGHDPYLDGLLGFAYALSGSTAKARKVLKELMQRLHREYVPAFSMALVYIGLGDRDQAMELLAKSSSDRSTYMVFAKADPLLDSVRLDPRFSSLLDRMGLQ